ncbi:MAG: spore coat protein [Ruminococcaceae bacterium]|nr:spore coat protein [Oscillospiraceae bacterium]
MALNQTPAFDDRARITDLLNTEKMLAATYNTFCSEAATPAVRSCLCTTLTEEHRMGETLFSEMSSRSWYTVEKAEENKVTEAKQKFSKTVTV